MCKLIKMQPQQAKTTNNHLEVGVLLHVFCTLLAQNEVRLIGHFNHVILHPVTEQPVVIWVVSIYCHDVICV